MKQKGCRLATFFLVSLRQKDILFVAFLCFLSHCRTNRIMRLFTSYLCIVKETKGVAAA